MSSLPDTAGPPGVKRSPGTTGFPGTTGSYRQLLAVPALRGLALADACARLPQGMVTITLLLVASAHASIATAGLVVTGYTLGQAVTGPLRGRLADRRGLAVVCAACAAVYTAALLGLLAASLARAPGALLIATAAAAGLSCPPLSPGMRSLWAAQAAGRLHRAAFALDAALFDLAYITGPVVASSLAAGLSPAAAVALLLALTAAATAIIGRRARGPRPGRPPGGGARRTGRPARERGRAGGPLRVPALRRLLVTGVLVNLALSGTEVALTGYLREHHALWASGPLLAELSAGSILGSLLLGTRKAAARLPRLAGWYALGLLLLAAAALRAPLVAVAAPVAGLCLGPSLATLFGLASAAAPEGGTEAQAWLNSAMNGGAAAGAALAGILLTWPGPGPAGPALTLAAMAVAAAAAAAAGHITVSGSEDSAFICYFPQRHSRKEARVGNVPRATAVAHAPDPVPAQPDRVPGGTGPAR
jgi:MFS family permease